MCFSSLNRKARSWKENKHQRVLFEIYVLVQGEMNICPSRYSFSIPWTPISGPQCSVFLGFAKWKAHLCCCIIFYSPAHENWHLDGFWMPSAISWVKAAIPIYCTVRILIRYCRQVGFAWAHREESPKEWTAILSGNLEVQLKRQ